MKQNSISLNTHQKIWEAMDIIDDISKIRKIVEEAKTEEEILKKLEELEKQNKNNL